MDRSLVDLVLVFDTFEVSTPAELVDVPLPDARDHAIAAVALCGDFVALAHDHKPDSPYGLAVTVVDTAHGQGMSLEDIALHPWAAVNVTRLVWAQLPGGRV
jgi:hypothetical protein